MVKNTIKTYGLICLLAISVLCNVMLLVGIPSQSGNITSDTTRIIIIDTIAFRHPVPVDSVVARYKTVRLPIMRDTVRICCTDSAEVELPISQKRYADSTYTAWVSGYNPSLDSIQIYPRHEVATIANTIQHTHTKKWGVGLNIGYGFTPCHGTQPYVGIGVTYNLFSF
jgi:hypothetical protein